MRLTLRSVCFCGDVVHIRQLLHVIWSWFYWWNGLLSRANLLGLVHTVALDFLKKRQLWKYLENCPLEFSCFSIDTHWILARRIQPESFHLTFPPFYCSWSVLHLSNTQNGISIDKYFCLCPFDRLIIGWYRSRPRKGWTLQEWTFRISSECSIINFFSISSNFCVLVDFRIRHNSAEGGWRLLSTKSQTFSISIHVFCMLGLRMLRHLLTRHSQLLLQTPKDLAHVLMVRAFHVSQFWFGCWSSCTKFLDACGTFACRLAWQYPTSEFESGGTSCLDACTTSFLSSAFPGLTRDPKILWRDFLTPFARAPPGMVSLSPSESLHLMSSFDLVLTWRSAFQSDQTCQRENHWNGYKKNRETQILEPVRLSADTCHQAYTTWAII